MIFQCRYILKQCKKFKNSEFKYNNKTNKLYNVHKLDEFVEIKKYTDEADILLQKLADDNFLETTKFGYKVTCKGLHRIQISIREFSAFLIKSIVVPIVLSILTTLITLYITA